VAVLFLALLVIGGFAWYVLTPAERVRIQGPLIAALRRVQRLVLLSYAELGPFRAALRARTRMPLAVPALAAAGVVVFALMAAGPGALDDPDTLVAWGASFGPRTTNGEWWRLVAMLSVHAGVLHLVVNTTALVQAGLLVERLVGTAAFVAVYVAAGLAAGLVDLAVSPVGVSAGASGAIAGVYGLLIAAFGWSHLSRSDVAIPWRAVVLLAPLAAIFAVYNLNTGMIGREGQIAGFATGLGLGLALAAGVSERKPSLKRSAVALAASVIVVAGLALPMRGMTDPRHALEEVLAMEDRTAAIYARAVQQFRAGRVPAVALADLIEGTILPEVRAAAAPLASLARVPRDYQELVRHAEEYLRLRGDSWHLRAAALRSASMPRLREADQVERASLEALDRARPMATGG
jgi:membrane associated rhomboid family serine protease